MSQTAEQVPPKRTQPTLYDVSRMSAVSSATVSRVFSGRARVSNELRNRVLEAARQLGYEPSHAARVLAGRKTNTLGAVFPEIASGFYADILAGIDQIAAESGFDVLASFVGKRRSYREVVTRLMRQGRVDALILLNLDDSWTLDPASSERMPLILIDHEIRGLSLPVLGIDNVGGAEAVIEHLFEQGHRRIGILTGPEGNYDSNQRLLGCQNAMRRVGLTFDQNLVWTGGFTVESGVQAAKAILSSRAPLPDAIFCLNDSMAIGMMTEFRSAGISVPGDVALAGYDNVEAAAHLSLTSVACPMRLMGQMAARWAVDMVSGSAQKPTGHCVQVRLVVRESSMGHGGAGRSSGNGSVNGGSRR
jgi:LacI family transcriptional regulator